MKAPGTLLLKRGDGASLLGLDECIGAVEEAFRSYVEGQTLPPGVLGVHARAGGFNIKASGLNLARTYFAAKVNGNFFRNTERYGMPNIQGIIMLCDGDNGYPLALMDSIEITILLTVAATAVADKLSIEVQAVRDLARAVAQSDVCVTCTPSRQFFLKREDVAPGTFIAAVGADDERKQELDPRLFAGHKIVVDVLEQCAAIGDLHHALDQALITRADVHAELGEVVAGKKPGRTSRDEIIIFDSTGTALQDAAAAALVYEKAEQAGSHFTLNFAG